MPSKFYVTELPEGLLEMKIKKRPFIVRGFSGETILELEVVIESVRTDDMITRENVVITVNNLRELFENLGGYFEKDAEFDSVLKKVEDDEKDVEPESNQQEEPEESSEELSVLETVETDYRRQMGLLDENLESRRKLYNIEE